MLNNSRIINFFHFRFSSSLFELVVRGCRNLFCHLVVHYGLVALSVGFVTQAEDNRKHGENHQRRVLFSGKKSHVQCHDYSGVGEYGQEIETDGSAFRRVRDRGSTSCQNNDALKTIAS